MRVCKKEWADQWNPNIVSVATTVDAHLKHFKKYKKLNTNKATTTPIPRKPSARQGSDNETEQLGINLNQEVPHLKGVNTRACNTE